MKISTWWTARSVRQKVCLAFTLGVLVTIAVTVLTCEGCLGRAL